MGETGGVVWEPRIGLDSIAIFAAVYLAVTIALAVVLARVLLRRGCPLRRLRWAMSVYLAAAVGAFLWLIGSPPAPAALLGAGMIPSALIASGGGARSGGPQSDEDGP